MIMRPGTAQVAPGSARQAKPQIIFGRSYSSQNLGTNCAKQSKVMPKQPLSRDTLANFNINKPSDRNIEEDIYMDQENKNTGLPPKTPNQGKVPKYLQKFKDEARIKEDARLEAKAQKNRPAGTRLMPEEERVATLETLNKSRKDITKILCQMPISMRTQSLVKQKTDLEAKLLELDKAVETFSRK